MRSEIYGSWKMLAGKKFTAFTRAYRSNVEVQKILENFIRKINYKTPIFLRELRGGGFIIDYLEEGGVTRAKFVMKNNDYVLESKYSLQLHPEVEGYLTERDFFGQVSISEDLYRNYYASKYFHRPLKTEPINMFAARIKDDNIEGLIMHHSYTEPFIEYVMKKDNYLIVSDKPPNEVKIPEINLPEGFEVHVIDETKCQKRMIFARVDNIEIMYPEELKNLDEMVRVPTMTHGMVRLIPVPARDPGKILERVSKISNNIHKIYIRSEKTTIITDDGKIIVYHGNPPRIVRH